ncbi:hypothetical protein EMCRGX_G005397 [Ephydatia muelleri]
MSLLVVGKSANERKRVVVEKVSSSEESSAEEGCGEERSRRTLQDATDGAWMLKLNISVPSQTQFHCEVCTLNYTTLASLRRHLKTSHSRYTVEESFSCDVCGKLASTLKAIKAHQKSTHIGTAPQTATFDDDANSVSPCPYCPLRFPSKKSLGQHVRGKHMDEASSERAAASRDNDGKRKLWDPVEVDKFKEALRRLGPSSNVDIANEIGTRTWCGVGSFLQNPPVLGTQNPVVPSHVPHFPSDNWMGSPSTSRTSPTAITIRLSGYSTIRRCCPQTSWRTRPPSQSIWSTEGGCQSESTATVLPFQPWGMHSKILDDTPPTYCTIPEPELIAHFSATYAPPQPISEPPPWLVALDSQEDVLATPFTPSEVLHQMQRAKKSAPGSDKLTYANWKWADPEGVTLAAVFNICREAGHIPPDWKGSTVTLLPKGGDPTVVRNWRPICLQKTIYKLYSAAIARRIADWAMTSGSILPTQKGFLPYDGCAEHSFVLRSALNDSRRRKRNVVLAWLDLRDAFGSVSHELLLLMMSRLGLTGKTIDVVNDIYKDATVAINTGRDTYTTDIAQSRGVKQGCPLSPLLFNIALEGLLRHLGSCNHGYSISNSVLLNHLAYAGDVCILAGSRMQAQALLDRKIDTRARKWLKKAVRLPLRSCTLILVRSREVSSSGFSDSEGEGPIPSAGTPACHSTSSQHHDDNAFRIRFPSQTTYQCPVCELWYNILPSLRRHVKKSHPAYLYQELFACDVCGYETGTLKSVNSHVRTQHGTVNPPEAPNGAFQCPHCVMRFPSKVSCSQHVRGRHMEEACQARAAAAASTTNEKRKPWTQEKRASFEAALKLFGPSSNVAIAKAIGSRTAAQNPHLKTPDSARLLILPEVAQGETVPRLSSQHASHQDPTPAPAVDLDDLDATLRLPFYEDLVPFKDRVMGEPEWITFQKVISRWSTVIQGLTATQQHRPSNPSAEWGKRRRRNKNGAQEPRDLEQPQNTTAEPSAVDDESGTRASGRARHAAKARFFQGLYKRNPAECV